MMQTANLDIVGSTVFGRYPKISVNQTWNMIISDDFLVSYAGYKKKISITNSGIGRGIFNSTRSNRLIVVIEDSVYSITPDFQYTKIGDLKTFEGDVFIDENNARQIAISDLSNLYIYDYEKNEFLTSNVDFNIDFIPGYICFQDGYFITTFKNQSKWGLSESNNGKIWPTILRAPFQTKPDNPVGIVRFPGKGNLLLVIGSIVTEPWMDIGLQRFPYQRNSGYNIDYGCLNPSTIASNDNFVVWLASNEKSGPFIAYTDGGMIKRISNDGIDFRLSQLKNPSNSYAFLFQQDGHLIYQITWPDDNITYAYDFNTNKFFNLCDPFMNSHIAKKVVFFNGSYYFVSLIDGNLYELSTKYNMQNENIMPRIRICSNLRLPNQRRFVVSSIGFTIEQGENSDIPLIDLNISRDGGETFGSSIRKYLNKEGKRQNILNYFGLGSANDFVPQFRFWTNGRVLATNGLIEYYI